MIRIVLQLYGNDSVFNYQGTPQSPFNVEKKLLNENRQSFLNYINEKTILCLQNSEEIGKKLNTLYEKGSEAYAKLFGEIKHLAPSELFVNEATFLKKAMDFSVLELNGTLQNFWLIKTENHINVIHLLQILWKWKMIFQNC